VIGGEEEDDLERIMDDMLKSRGVDGKNGTGVAPLNLIKNLSSQSPDYSVSIPY